MIIRIEGSSDCKEIEVSSQDKVIFKINQKSDLEQLEKVTRKIEELWKNNQVFVLPEFIDIYVIHQESGD